MPAKQVSDRGRRGARPTPFRATISASHRERGMRITSALRINRSDIRNRGLSDRAPEHAQLVPQQQEFGVASASGRRVRTRSRREAEAVVHAGQEHERRGQYAIKRSRRRDGVDVINALHILTRHEYHTRSRA